MGVKITPQQCKAARAALGWPRWQLATEAKISQLTLLKFENGETAPLESTVASVTGVLIAAGIEFFGAEGDRPGIRFIANA
jgi:ribosome-binding protein aMBF1 (putative translation factor)